MGKTTVSVTHVLPTRCPPWFGKTRTMVWERLRNWYCDSGRVLSMVRQARTILC